MSMKSAAHLKKVESAVRILQTTTGVKVQQAMILAHFLKKDIASDSIRRVIQCCSEKQPPTNIIVCNKSSSTSPVLLDVSLLVVSSVPRNPKPKCKQTRLTASAAQQKRVNDLEAKRYKSDAHKAAV